MVAVAAILQIRFIPEKSAGVIIDMEQWQGCAVSASLVQCLQTERMLQCKEMLFWGI